MFVHDGRETDNQNQFGSLLQKLEEASRQMGIPLRMLRKGRAVSLLSSDTRKMIEAL
jgi:hypothetical protein